MQFKSVKQENIGEMRAPPTQKHCEVSYDDPEGDMALLDEIWGSNSIVKARTKIKNKKN